MARQPMVTRTILTTRCTVLCMDVQQGEPCNTTIDLPRTYKDDASLLKAAKKAIDTDTLKAVHIVHSEVCESLYGMSEQEFITHAHILPPRKDYTNPGEADDTNPVEADATIEV